MINNLKILRKNLKITMMIKSLMHTKMEILLGMEKVSLHLENTAAKVLMEIKIYLKMERDQW